MRPRIDTLDPGTAVRLEFNNGEYEEIAIFAGIIGEGDDRRARFVQAYELEPKAFEWDAYRYLGHWAYGTSAQPVRLEEVIS